MRFKLIIMKKEDLEEYINYMFKQNENISKKERYVRAYMYCKTYGLNNITNFNHCGNEECAGCNSFTETITKVFKEEVERLNFKPYEKI